MYSKVDQASELNATNGLSESMVELLPSRNTPPSLTAPPLPEELPHAAAARAMATAAATRPGARRDGRGRVACWLRRSLTRVHLLISNADGRRSVSGRTVDRWPYPE